MQILNKEISCIKFKFEAIELVLSALAPSILTPEPENPYYFVLIYPSYTKILKFILN